MRIVHIITCLDVGGAEMMLKRLLLAGTKAAQDERVISLTTLGPIGLELQQAGIQVDCLELDKSVVGAVRKFFRLVALLRRLKPDVVQTWMYHADLFAGLAARLAGCRRIVWGIRGTFTPIGRPMTHRIMQLCALLSAIIPKKIVCVAEAARRSHIQYGYSANKMLVVHNGLDFSHFDKAVDRALIRQQWGILPGQQLIGSVGRFHPDKGQDLLIEAFASVASINPQCRLVLIGRDCSTDNDALMQLIAHQQLTDKVLLLGERSDIVACLQAFDIYCMPSRTEGFPNGLAEAMSAGLPAVATDVGDATVLAADTVIFARPQSASLVQALTQLCQTKKAERDRLGQAAATRVRELFSIQAIRQRYDELYTSIMES